MVILNALVVSGELADRFLVVGGLSIICNNSCVRILLN
jgi:hypothetical protein